MSGFYKFKLFVNGKSQSIRTLQHEKTGESIENYGYFVYNKYKLNFRGKVPFEEFTKKNSSAAYSYAYSYYFVYRFESLEFWTENAAGDCRYE